MNNINICKECALLSIIKLNAKIKDFPIEIEIMDIEEIEDKPKAFVIEPYFEKWDFRPMFTPSIDRILVNSLLEDYQGNVVIIREEKGLKELLKRVKLIIHPNCSFCDPNSYEEPFYTEEEIESIVKKFRERKANYYKK